MYIVRLFIFSVASNTAFLFVAGLFASLVSAYDFPAPFSWPFGLYLLASYPLDLVLTLVPAYEQFQWSVSPEGGPAAAFIYVLTEAFITWVIIFMLFRHFYVKHRSNVA